MRSLVHVFVPRIHHPDQIMDFFSLQKVIKSTRRQLERELFVLEDIQRIEGMPSYRFLAR
jgi:ELMO domain-containing protein